MVVTSQVLGSDEVGTENDIKLAKSHYLIHDHPARRLAHIVSPL